MYTKHRHELYHARKSWVKTLVRPLPSFWGRLFVMWWAGRIPIYTQARSCSIARYWQSQLLLILSVHKTRTSRKPGKRAKKAGVRSGSLCTVHSMPAPWWALETGAERGSPGKGKEGDILVLLYTRKGRCNQRHILIDRRPSRTAWPACWAMGTNEIVYGEEKNILYKAD